MPELEQRPAAVEERIPVEVRMPVEQRMPVEERMSEMMVRMPGEGEERVGIWRAADRGDLETVRQLINQVYRKT